MPSIFPFDFRAILPSSGCLPARSLLSVKDSSKKALESALIVDRYPTAAAGEPGDSKGKSEKLWSEVSTLESGQIVLVRLDVRSDPRRVSNVAFIFFDKSTSLVKCDLHTVNPGELMIRVGGDGESRGGSDAVGAGRGSSHGSKAMTLRTGREGRLVSGEGVLTSCNWYEHMALGMLFSSTHHRASAK